MLYMVDVVVLMKLYFEPSHVRLTQPQPLPHSIFDLDQALIRIIETAYLVKTARRQSLDAHRIYWRGYRLGSDAKASACDRACATSKRKHKPRTPTQHSSLTTTYYESDVSTTHDMDGVRRSTRIARRQATAGVAGEYRSPSQHQL